MATHSSVLAWKIPRTEEPGGLHTVPGVTESDRTEATWHAFCLCFYFPVPPIRIQVSGGQPPTVVLRVCPLAGLGSRSVTKCV